MSTSEAKVKEELLGQDGAGPKLSAALQALFTQVYADAAAVPLNSYKTAIEPVAFSVENPSQYAKYFSIYNANNPTTKIPIYGQDPPPPEQAPAGIVPDMPGPKYGDSAVLRAVCRFSAVCGLAESLARAVRQFGPVAADLSAPTSVVANANAQIAKNASQLWLTIRDMVQSYAQKESSAIAGQLPGNFSYGKFIAVPMSGGNTSYFNYAVMCHDDSTPNVPQGDEAKLLDQLPAMGLDNPFVIYAYGSCLGLTAYKSPATGKLTVDKFKFAEKLFTTWDGVEDPHQIGDPKKLVGIRLVLFNVNQVLSAPFFKQKVTQAYVNSWRTSRAQVARLWYTMAIGSGAEHSPGFEWQLGYEALQLKYAIHDLVEQSSPYFLHPVFAQDLVDKAYSLDFPGYKQVNSNTAGQVVVQSLAAVLAWGGLLSGKDFLCYLPTVPFGLDDGVISGDKLKVAKLTTKIDCENVQAALSAYVSLPPPAVIHWPLWTDLATCSVPSGSAFVVVRSCSRAMTFKQYYLNPGILEAPPLDAIVKAFNDPTSEISRLVRRLMPEIRSLAHQVYEAALSSLKVLPPAQVAAQLEGQLEFHATCMLVRMILGDGVAPGQVDWFPKNPPPLQPCKP